MDVCTEPIRPIRISKCKKFIVCLRLEIYNRLQVLHEDIERSIQHQPYVTSLEKNTVYAVKVTDKKKFTRWRRALLKTEKADVPLLACMDVSIIVPFVAGQTQAKVIPNQLITRQMPGELKLFLYGLKMARQENLEQFFESIKFQDVTGVFRRIELKPNRIDEVYAGDIIYIDNKKGRMCSLRQQIIQQRAGYARLMDNDLNNDLFAEAIRVVRLHNVQRLPAQPPIAIDHSTSKLQGESIRSFLKRTQAEQQQHRETEGAVGGTIEPSVDVLSSLVEKLEIIGWSTTSQSNVVSKESEVSKYVVGGRYELLKMYGEGAFGAVTKAIDLKERT